LERSGDNERLATLFAKIFLISLVLNFFGLRPTTFFLFLPKISLVSLALDGAADFLQWMAQYFPFLHFGLTALVHLVPALVMATHLTIYTKIILYRINRYNNFTTYSRYTHPIKMTKLKARPESPWHSQAPIKSADREEVLSHCGKKCFLMPEQKKFPICKMCSKNTCQCKPDCKGLRAAKIRAGQWGYEAVKQKAMKIYEEQGCASKLAKKKKFGNASLPKKRKIVLY
jgi:hypothetical protein